MPHRYLHTRPGQPPDANFDYARQYGEAFASRWDELIDWDKRIAGEDGFFTELLLGVGVSSVLDVATGSGFHAVQLKKAGFRVSACDGSQAMVDRAKINFARHGLKIPLARCDWLDLDPAQLGTFDAVLCLGNSLCHMFDDRARLAVLRRFRSLLRPGGLLVVDQRNFQAILAGDFTLSGRFYEGGDTVRETLGEVNEWLCEFVYTFSDEATYRLRVAPLRSQQVRREIVQSGFVSVQSFGDFKWIYDAMRVDSILHVARRA